MSGDGGDRDGGRDTHEDEERRHQKAAADAEHPRDESDGEPHRKNEEHVDRQFGDGKIDLHGRYPPVRTGRGLPPRSSGPVAAILQGPNGWTRL